MPADEIPETIILTTTNAVFFDHNIDLLIIFDDGLLLREGLHIDIYFMLRYLISKQSGASISTPSSLITFRGKPSLLPAASLIKHWWLAMIFKLFVEECAYVGSRT